jgi:small-conductance mechanosensitive channel
MDNAGEVFQDLLTQAIEFLPKVVFSLTIFVLGLLVAGFLSRLMRRAVQRRGAGLEAELLVSKIIRWSIVVVVSIVALQQIDFDVTAFLTGLGIVGFTIGFAIQDVSKNFVAGLLLLLQQPFNIGDAIKVGGFSGTVTSVDLRATGLQTIDGREVLIPNAEVFTSPIEKYGRDTHRRVEIAAGVAYESDLDHVAQVALRVISEINGVISSPEPSVIFDNLGPSTVDLMAYFWIDRSQISVMRARDAGVRAIKQAFEAEGIDMPYPIQTVFVHQEN